jgi:hypothetical protein
VERQVVEVINTVIVLPKEGLISVEDLATYIRTTPGTLKSEIKKRNIPYLRISGKWLVKLEDITV